MKSKIIEFEEPFRTQLTLNWFLSVKTFVSIQMKDNFTRMIIIEDQKFDFAFLQTILLAWKRKQTEDAKKAEAERLMKLEKQRKEEEAKKKEKLELKRKEEEEKKKAEEAEALKNAPEVSVTEVRVNDVSRLQQMAFRRKSPAIAPFSSSAKPIAAVTPMPPAQASSTSTDQYQMMKQTVKTKVATPDDPMLVSNGEGELPIRSKCSHCNDRNSEKITDFIHHYSTTHFRAELESRVQVRLTNHNAIIIIIYQSQITICLK